MDYLNELAPFSEASDFDNSGLQTGSLSNNVTRAIIALDLTRSVLDMVKRLKAELVVVHHPLIFKAVKQIESSSLLYDVVCNNLNVVAVHTNLDKAEQGVSFNLAKVLELQQISNLVGSDGFGRLGFLREGLSCEVFLRHVSKKLNLVVKSTKFEGLIEKVAVVSGAGGSFWKLAKENGANALVTGECRHNNFVDAFNEGFCLVEAGHFETENLICEPLKQKLSKQFKNVEFVVAKNCEPGYGFFHDFKWL